MYKVDTKQLGCQVTGVVLSFLVEAVEHAADERQLQHFTLFR
jgi:hypothetical protein